MWPILSTVTRAVSWVRPENKSQFQIAGGKKSPLGILQPAKLSYRCEGKIKTLWEKWEFTRKRTCWKNNWMMCVRKKHSLSLSHTHMSRNNEVLKYEILLKEFFSCSRSEKRYFSIFDCVKSKMKDNISTIIEWLIYSL